MALDVMVAKLDSCVGTWSLVFDHSELVLLRGNNTSGDICGKNAYTIFHWVLALGNTVDNELKNRSR